MPIAPTYPGVYIQEVPSSVHTITGVATSIAAFFGQATEGPINEAKRILSYADFQRTFGLPHPESELDTAVRLFFQNGGSDCYVIRLVKAGTGGKTSIITKNEGGTNVLKFTAKEIGIWGNEMALEVDYDTAQPEDTFNLRIYRLNLDGTPKTTEEYLNCSMDLDSPKFPPKLVSQESKLVDCEHTSSTDTAFKNKAPKSSSAGYSESGRPFDDEATALSELASMIATPVAPNIGTYKFKISIDSSPFYEVNLQDIVDATNDTFADIPGLINTALNNALPPQYNNKVTITFEPYDATTKLVLRFTSNTTEAKSIVIQPADSEDVTGVLMLGTDQGGIEPTRYSILRPAPNGIFLKRSAIKVLANHPNDHFNILTLEGNDIDLGTKLTDGQPSTAWHRDQDDNYDGVREKLAILATEIDQSSIGWTATVSGSRLFIKKKSGQSNYSASITSAPADIGSLFEANTRYYSSAAGGVFHGATIQGTDGLAPTAADYKGNEAKHEGFYALDLVDLFNLMIIPNDRNLDEAAYRSLWGPASAYCKNHRAFLLVDPPASWYTSFENVTSATTGINKLRIGVVKDHAAVFYPRISVRENGINRMVGPAGAIAGLMARTDVARGIWKAPAGTEAGIISINGIEVNLTDLENGVLNKQGVNCIRQFPSGIVNWGGRTMDGADDFGSQWKYIPIRRLALFIEESLFRGTKWVVFEPNDEPLWSKIRLNIGTFMNRLFRQGAFQGDTPAKAYFVKCDGETTPASDRNLGIVNIEVGFAPLKPAEFVIIKIQQIPDL